MYHYIAKLGRARWAKGVMPIGASIVTLGYFAGHTIGFDIIRRFMTAQSPSGQREEISSHLQDLIKSVYNDIKDDYNKEINPLPVQARLLISDVVIRWFPSCSMEPMTLGGPWFETGVLIGLPYFYNFREEHELPASYTSIKKIRFFLPTDGNKKKSSEEECIDCEVENSTPIIRDSEQGREYLESLILSDEAKKYSIARELFLSSTYRPLCILSIIMFSMLLPLYMSRAIVTKLKLAEKHVTQRLPYYPLAGLVGYFNYCFLSDAVNQYYYQKVDNKARAIDDSYRRGAIEYYAKMIQRHKALRVIDPELKNIYNEDGNYREPIYRNKFIVLTDYISKVTQSDNQEQEAECHNE